MKISLKVKTTYFFADSLHLHRKKQPSFSTTSMARIDVLAGMVDETKPLMGENGRQEGKEEGQRKSGLLFCYVLLRKCSNCPKKRPLFFPSIANAKTDAMIQLCLVSQWQNFPIQIYPTKKRMTLNQSIQNPTMCFLFLCDFRPQT